MAAMKRLRCELDTIWWIVCHPIEAYRYVQEQMVANDIASAVMAEVERLERQKREELN